MPKGKKHTKKTGKLGHHIRAWRDYRGLTLERLAERIGLTHGTLSRIERGKTAYTQPVLEALADALQTDPASLIMRDPGKPDIWSILDSIPASDRPMAARALEGFAKKTGTDG